MRAEIGIGQHKNKRRRSRRWEYAVSGREGKTPNKFRQNDFPSESFRAIQFQPKRKWPQNRSPSSPGLTTPPAIRNARPHQLLRSGPHTKLYQHPSQVPKPQVISHLTCGGDLGWRPAFPRNYPVAKYFPRRRDAKNRQEFNEGNLQQCKLREQSPRLSCGIAGPRPTSPSLQQC